MKLTLQPIPSFLSAHFDQAENPDLLEEFVLRDRIGAETALSLLHFSYFYPLFAHLWRLRNAGIPIGHLFLLPLHTHPFHSLRCHL